MRSVDKEKIRKSLIENHFTQERVDLILKNFPLLNDELADAVDQWLEEHTIAQIEVDGLSIENVMRLRQCHFLVAVKDLGRLIDSSLPVEKRTRLREILSKPVILE